MRILLGIALVFSAFIALSYIVGSLFTALIAGEPKRDYDKTNKSDRSEETALSRSLTANDNEHAVKATNNNEKQCGDIPEVAVVNNASTYATGRIANKIIQMHDAEIRYPNTIHSSYDKCLTSLGVFDDPLFIDFKGEIAPCGFFRKPISDGNDSFFFRLADRDIIIPDYDNSTYHTSFFAYSIPNQKYESIYHNSDTIIQFEDYKNYIVEIWTSGDYFYYLDERSDFCLQKCKLPEGFHPADAHISDDGDRFLFGKYESQKNYVYDISSGMIKLLPGGSYNTFTLPLIQPDMPHYYHFYYSADDSKNSQIMNKYLKMHPEIEYQIIENEFEDDIAVNIDAKIPADNREAMSLCQYLNQSIKKCVIYGISPSTIVDVAGKTYRYYRYLYPKISVGEREDCEIIFEKIKEKYGYDDIQALEYIYNKHCACERVDPNFDNEAGKKVYREVFQKMVEDGEATTRWKSELQMFNVIHSHFENALFQYRDDELLGLQSFDAYVPDLRIAFEYQGKQHYEPIPFFGGEEGFKRLRERDKRKKEICNQNGITLIEWKYDEPISQATLKRKLCDHRIN